ncbi:hypothetical protein LOC67_17430 [Stieleria sp. JC731]|uniref:hypothetical protein n=1 Tax=Pirellulaceae TaxID=2691357 RepID=UPI001E31EB80|nr:hypothetical protein [Stieleria sp. JC731]MCC9602339.1 hypothetical protein [Stieleria sp. JC731]
MLKRIPPIYLPIDRDVDLETERWPFICPSPVPFISLVPFAPRAARKAGDEGQSQAFMQLTRSGQQDHAISLPCGSITAECDGYSWDASRRSVMGTVGTHHGGV